jgi:hypothetical protein
MSIKKPKKTLAEIKAAFGNDSEEKSQNNFNNLYYPFWNMPDGTRCVIRFLPDLNDDNPRGFLVEKVVHSLEINGKKQKIPCLSMYGEACPICELSQKYYKEKDEVNGKLYWKNKQYLAQAIVVEDPIPADETGEKHEGKVRMIALGYQIFKIIKASFADDELEGVPYDIEEGHDFIIRKTAGKYADYTTGTKFMNKSRALNAEELVAAEEGMVDLATLLPKHPGLEKVQAMLDAHRNGTAYTDDSAPKPAAKAKAKADDEIPFEQPQKSVETKVAEALAPAKEEAAAEPASNNNVDDMLAQIRNRRKAAAAAK